MRKSVSTALVIALLNSGNFALANSLIESSDEQGPLAMSAMGKGFDYMKDTLVSHSKAVQETHHAPMVEKYLIEGKLADGEIALTARLKEHNKDDQARFGLGVLQFLRAVERLGQNLYRYGVRDFSQRGFVMPFLRLPIANNPAPEMINYQQMRKIVDTFRENLVQAEATLALITDGAVKLPLHFGMIRLDLNGDGRADESEGLWKVYAQLTNNTNIPLEQAKQFFIKFDRGDVHWLRGYCHLLSSVCDMYLTYDSKETFERTAQLFFTRVDTPYEDLSRGKHFHSIGQSDTDVLDLIALVHLIRWEVVEPQRMEAALHHLEAVITQSRETWKWIMAETDDDHEWLPNPRQTGVIPNVKVTEEMVTSWAEIMNESDKILAGKLLIPFWRSDDSQGINVRKLFLEPRTFDLVLWVQGTPALPYLQKGELTKGDTWRKLQGAFGNNFPGFALWFN